MRFDLNFGSCSTAGSATPATSLPMCSGGFCAWRRAASPAWTFCKARSTRLTMTSALPEQTLRQAHDRIAEYDGGAADDHQCGDTSAECHAGTQHSRLLPPHQRATHVAEHR